MAAPSTPRVLLTGATGLLGPYLARALQPHYRIRATRRPASDVSGLRELSGIDWRTGELDDPAFLDECLRDADAVVHAAAYVSHDPRDAPHMRHVNVGLTRALVDAALAHGTAHFLHVSSVAAISPARREAIATEADLTFFPQDDTSAYARSKLAGELEVWRGAEEGLPVTILSPSIVLGVGDWSRSSAQLIDWVARGQRYYPPGGTGFVDARDVGGFRQNLPRRGSGGTALHRERGGLAFCRLLRRGGRGPRGAAAAGGGQGLASGVAVAGRQREGGPPEADAPTHESERAALQTGDALRQRRELSGGRGVPPARADDLGRGPRLRGGPPSRGRLRYCPLNGGKAGLTLALCL